MNAYQIQELVYDSRSTLNSQKKKKIHILTITFGHLSVVLKYTI